MRYEEWRPAPDLRGRVDRYWRLIAPGAAGVERALPDAHSELVVHLGEPCYRLEPGLEPVVQPRSLFIGQTTRPVELQPRGGLDVFGVRFRHEAAPLPLQDSIAALDDAIGGRSRQWEDRLRSCKTGQHMCQVTDDYLREGFPWPGSIDARIRAAVGLLRTGASVGSTAEAVECSRRQFERNFQSRVGLAPKRFARICRFQRALAIRREQPSWSWAATAAECGYFDQAHLVLDFTEFGGDAPTMVDSNAGEMARSLAARDAFFQDGAHGQG